MGLVAIFPMVFWRQILGFAAYLSRRFDDKLASVDIEFSELGARGAPPDADEELKSFLRDEAWVLLKLLEIFVYTFGLTIVGLLKGLSVFLLHFLIANPRKCGMPRRLANG